MLPRSAGRHLGRQQSTHLHCETTAMMPPSDLAASLFGNPTNWLVTGLAATRVVTAAILQPTRCQHHWWGLENPHAVGDGLAK